MSRFHRRILREAVRNRVAILALRRTAAHLGVRSYSITAIYRPYPNCIAAEHSFSMNDGRRFSIELPPRRPWREAFAKLQEGLAA